MVGKIKEVRGDNYRQRRVLIAAEKVEPLLSLPTTADYIIFTVLAAVSYFWSLYLLGWYVRGDQTYYVSFYNSLVGAPIDDIAFLQKGYTGSSEYLYGYLMWVGAQFFPKDKFISAFNVVLVLLIFVYLRRKNVGYVVVGLMLTNYYVVVLMTSAERLKFSYVAVIAGLVFHRYVRYVFLCAAPFFHFQTLILYSSVVSDRLYDAAFKFIRTNRGFLQIVSLIVVVSVGGAYFWTNFFDILSSKVADSASAGGLSDLFNLGLLAAVGLLSARSKGKMMLALLPLSIAAVWLGGSRVNMIAFTVLGYLLIEEGKSGHYAFIALLGYFSYKTTGFIENVVLFGDGFAAR